MTGEANGRIGKNDMTRLDSVQKSRIRAAAAMTRAFSEHRNSDDLGDRLVEAY